MQMVGSRGSDEGKMEGDQNYDLMNEDRFLFIRSFLGSPNEYTLLL